MGVISRIRRTRQCAMARTIFQRVTDIHRASKEWEESIHLVQAGLGDWAEGPAVGEYFLNAVAVEPLQRYIWQAYQAGFIGPIIQGLLWDRTGDTLEIGDSRTCTSVHSKKGLETRQGNLGSIKSLTVTLDDALRWVEKSHLHNLFLWIDVEGAETKVLDGAVETLKRTNYLLMEAKEDTSAYPGWANAKQLTEKADSLGFDFVDKFDEDSLFVRRRTSD